MQAPPTVVLASTTDVFGRCAIEAGPGGFPVDHPTSQDGPGEYPGTIDHFLSGVASCGVLMVEYQAKLREIPLHRLAVRLEAHRGAPGARVPDRSLFDSIALHFEFEGPSEDQAQVLVEHYKRH
jgi:uncharacterized OsmC-like protein